MPSSPDTTEHSDANSRSQVSSIDLLTERGDHLVSVLGGKKPDSISETVIAVQRDPTLYLTYQVLGS